MARRVLLIDDDPGVLKSMTRCLTQLGFDVCQAATATEALAKLDGQDVVIIDLKLPDQPGTVVLRKIRTENRPIRTAIWTTSTGAAALPEVAALRPDAVFYKMDVEELLSVGGQLEGLTHAPPSDSSPRNARVRRLARILLNALGSCRCALPDEPGAVLRLPSHFDRRGASGGRCNDKHR
jgi:CheY-like chemotaxis protein